MAILNRKLFNRGGPVSSRGVGITSGLVPRYKHGGSISEHTTKEKFVDNMEMLKGLNLFQPQTFDAKENMTPYLLDLSARLLGGTSKRGGIGGALEIGGQAVGGANPLLSKALENKKEFEATDQEAPLKQMALQMALEKGEKPQYTTVKQGESLYKDGELVVEKIMPKKDQQLIKLNPNQILIDPITKQEVARGMVNADTDFFKLNPGQKIFDKNNNVIAFYEDTDEDIIKLNPGQKAFDARGNLLFESPATEQEGKIFKLSQGQKAFDASGNEIASVAAKEPKPIDTTITVSAGSKVINKETGEVIFDNPSNQDQTKIYKAQPGSTLVNEAGEVIYKAPEKKQYFKLKEGESIYDEKGAVIATGTAITDNVDKYQAGKTEKERYDIKLLAYEKKAGFLPNGKIDLSKLTELEQSDYNRILQRVDISAEKGAANWQEYVGENYSNINFVVDMDERLAQAERIFEQNQATGPVRGRISPILGVFQDVTGIDVASVVNKVFGNDDILQRPINARELERLRNEMGVQFQDVMKGQVSNFEQKMILNSFFSVLSLPESNQIAFNNLKYLNNLKRAQIQIAEQSTNSTDFFTRMELWKKENKPEILKDVAEKTSDIENKYGISLAKPVEEE
tara:strand:- start:1995 stop:3872 length:1878 start_codon:yes stop_codon:yes gene_type:complete